MRWWLLGFAILVALMVLRDNPTTTWQCVSSAQAIPYAAWMGEQGIPEHDQVTALYEHGFVPVLGQGWACP